VGPSRGCLNRVVHGQILYLRGPEDDILVRFLDGWDILFWWSIVETVNGDARMDCATCIPSRFGPHRVHLIQKRRMSASKQLRRTEGAVCMLAAMQLLTIGQLDRRSVGINARKNAPISYISMGNQRDWFPVETNGPKRDACQFLHPRCRIDCFVRIFLSRKEKP